MDLFAREANLCQLLEGPQVFPAGFLLGVVERGHILAGLNTEPLVNQPANMKT